ncbi:DMT family transporter [Celerinatantimonas sp. MCCC 1A17872]|uniref:DMT family transporter n=1 Tax=Celerinatantimonas sp. MCCC 1A17872 TaxID=3177514 RepID=UPI0038C4766E
MISARKAELLLLLTTFIAGWGWIFSKEASQGMPIFYFLGIRFSFAALLIALINMKSFTKVTRKNLKGLTISGTLQGISIIAWMYAVKVSTTLGEGAFIMSLSMLFVPVLARFLFKNKILKVFWISLPIAVVGLFCLTASTSMKITYSQVWFLIAAFLQSLYFCSNAFYAEKIPTIPLTSVQLLFTGVISLLLAFKFEIWPETVTAVTWGWVVASICIATSLRFYIQLTGQRFCSASNAAIIMVMEPVFTFIISGYWYHEELSVHKVIGCILILLALIIYQIKKIEHRKLSRKLNRDIPQVKV